MTLTELLLGSTHRFRVTFKDIETQQAIAMKNVTVGFYRNGTLVGTASSPQNDGVGIYYADKYFDPSVFFADKYECRFDGQTQAGDINKRAVKFFALVKEP